MINEEHKSQLIKIIPEGIYFDYPMEQMTTFRVGGKAEAVCFPRELNTLQELVTYFGRVNIPYMVIGKGSNLLVKDRGIPGAVIILKGELASPIKIQMDKEETLLSAPGGLSIPELLSYCSNNQLTGLEFLAGIPGTAGGAVAMNAGAHGIDIGRLVRYINVVDKGGNRVSLDENLLEFSYRKSNLSDGMIIYKVGFALKRAPREDISMKIMEYLRIRKATQPLDLPSGGSVFKNPPGDYAGRLIEKAGLKGERIGEAMISSKHANFIVNLGGAKARDIISLMELARKRVREESGIDLEPELRVVGE